MDDRSSRASPRAGWRGYLGSYLLRCTVGDEVEFATVLHFESLDALHAFAGEDYETAYVPPRAREMLARFDAKSVHCQTLPDPGGQRTVAATFPRRVRVERPSADTFLAVSGIDSAYLVA